MGLLKIPEPYKVGFRSIVSLEEASIEELLAVLKNVSPALYAKEIVEQIAPRIKTIPSEDIGNIIEALFSLYISSASSDEPPADFVGDVIQALHESDSKDLISSAELRDRFKKRLSLLLDIPPLLIGAKSYILLFEHMRNFRGARVFTDVRPIFAAGTEAKPAVMVIHQLKLSYLEGDEDNKEFFIAMDNKDIARLLVALQRAESKAKRLESLFAELNIQYIEPE